MTAQALENTLESAVFPKLFHRETVAMTHSLKVAEDFGKQHKNVLKSIKELNCSPEFWRLNFKPSNSQRKAQLIETTLHNFHQTQGAN